MARAAELNRQKATKADQAVERTTQELNRLLKAGRTRERARIEQSQQTTYRQQIKNVSEKFQRMLLRPGKGATQHAPANLVGGGVELLRALQRFRDAAGGPVAADAGHVL